MSTSLTRLCGISMGCLAMCFGMGYAFHKAFVRSMSENPLFIEAMETVKRHNGAIHLLGEPITTKSPTLANKGMLLAGYSDVQVRVSGPKSEGIVFLKVVEGKEKVNIASIQLQIGKDQSRRLVIKDSEKENADLKDKISLYCKLSSKIPATLESTISALKFLVIVKGTQRLQYGVYSVKDVDVKFFENKVLTK